MSIRNGIGDIRFMNALFTTAEHEAHELGDDVPGAEHLLLAALTLPDDSGRRALTTCAATIDDVRGAIAATHADALRFAGVAPQDADPSGPASARKPQGPFRSSGTAQLVFQRAVALSKLDRPPALRSAHIVLAVAELEHGTSSRVLRRLGIDPATLQRAAREAMTSPGP